MKRFAGLSVVIPAFDEAESVRDTILEAIPVLARLAAEWEIVVVDDGSRDRTSAVVEDLLAEHSGIRLLRHLANRGFGAAFRTGLRACRYDFVTLLPADGQFPPGELEKLIAVSDGVDVVLGVRGNRDDPVNRRLSTFFLRWLLLFLFGIGVRDGTWVKLFRRTALQAISPDVDGFAIDAQILARVCRRGYRIRQVPVGHRARAAGRAKGGDFLRVARAALDVVVVWWRESLR